MSAGRIPELRNEQIPGWLAALDRVRALAPHAIVPGFGPVVKDDAALTATGDYLRQLDAAVRRAYANGTGLTDAMRTVQVPDFRSYKLYAAAQPQNVQRLYLQLEKQ